MQFMMLVKSAESAGPPPQSLMDAIAAMAEEAVEAGRMIMSGGLAPTGMSSRVRLSQGELITTDGPFAEAKEVVGGFAMFQFASKEEAVQSAVSFMELHRQHWPGWEGETEIRQMFGPDDFPTRP
ncbi:MAG TPA: YciI family protein [Caulifigura sp.]|nr:YciI family protein [Caulifigura sp.]